MYVLVLPSTLAPNTQFGLSFFIPIRNIPIYYAGFARMRECSAVPMDKHLRQRMFALTECTEKRYTLSRIETHTSTYTYKLQYMFGTACQTVYCTIEWRVNTLIYPVYFFRRAYISHRLIIAVFYFARHLANQY